MAQPSLQFTTVWKARPSKDFSKAECIKKINNPKLLRRFELTMARLAEFSRT